jgi:hypothetical protein
MRFVSPLSPHLEDWRECEKYPPWRVEDKETPHLLERAAEKRLLDEFMSTFYLDINRYALYS